MSNSEGVTDRSLLMRAIVEATKKMWWASARIERDEERSAMRELIHLITEYQQTYHQEAPCQAKALF